MEEKAFDGLSPEPKTQKNGPRGLKPLDFEFWFAGNKTDRNSYKMALTVGIPGLGMGESPVPKSRKQDGAGRCLREDRSSK